eukprot:4296211-Pyramimonas_sp.AAC.1
MPSCGTWVSRRAPGWLGVHPASTVQQGGQGPPWRFRVVTAMASGQPSHRVGPAIRRRGSRKPLRGFLVFDVKGSPGWTSLISTTVHGMPSPGGPVTPCSMCRHETWVLCPSRAMAL